MSTSQKKILSLKQKKLKLLSTPSATLPPIISSSSQPEEIDKVTDETSTSSGLPLSGLCNLGNTCYANCILQVLRFCPHFSAEVARLSEVFSVSPTEAEVDGEGDQSATSSMEWEDSGGEGAMVTSLNTVCKGQ